MRKIFFFLFFLLPISSYALDPSCFRQTAVIENISGTRTILLSTDRDDIFFTQSGNILRSWKSPEQEKIIVPYTIVGDIDTKNLSDTDRNTLYEIDPYTLGASGVELIFDLGKVYPSMSLDIDIGYYSSSPVLFEVSRNGIEYISVQGGDIGDFEFRFIRMSFMKPKIQNDLTFLHTVQISEKQKTRYIVTGGAGMIQVYASYACDLSVYQDLILQRGGEGEIFDDTSPIEVRLMKNEFYRDDRDSDTIENIRDNCPDVSNPNQFDRTRDGIGDACSDDDRDSIVGLSDNCPTISNSDQKDQNVNRIGDACEFDSDSDGISDGEDNAIRIKNPDQKDADFDRIGDVMDNCSLYNPDQLDLDKNGKGDTCDREEEYRKVNDTDRDGTLDFQDNCRKISNPDQLDSDRDGYGDRCDNCGLIQNSDQADSDKNTLGDACEDTDRDGIDGWRDNCPMVGNPDQLDTDNDTIGNACEDTDGDRVSDSLDVCPIQYDPDQKDTDKDGIGNLCDTEDNRFLESNRTLFIVLFSCIGLLFIGIIIFLMRKINS